MRRTTSRLWLLCLLCGTAVGEEPSAATIMQRVAENQARAVEARKQWTFQQETFVRLSRTNGKLAREERKQFTVTPTPKGFAKQLTAFEGRYAEKGKIVNYKEPGFERKEMDIDAELVDDFPDDLVNDKGTRDGLDSDLFPLTPDKQRSYKFKLRGRERYREREVYRVAFEPAARDEFAWAGEVLVDTTEYQPVLVTTHLSKNLPLLVRTVFGTDIKYIGFKVEYQEFGEDVWFPVRYGGEFYLRALFLYRRKIAVTMRNSDFRKTDVKSTIEYAGIEP